MAHRDGRREETRRRILDVAGQMFRRDGVAATGVGPLMAASGLTNGAFYGHFASKEDLVRTVLLDTMSAARERFAAGPRTPEALRAFVERYLSPEHRDQPETGCTVAALAAEAARHAPDTRAACADELERMTELMAACLHGADTAAAHRAVALYALLSGTLQMARLSADDSGRSLGILAAGRAAALAMIEAGGT